MNGLAYSLNGGTSYGNAAITKDGAIDARFITTGELSANRVRTGVLQSVGTSPNVTFDLDNGLLTMKKGAITLGGTPSSPKFSVSDAGFFHALS